MIVKKPLYVRAVEGEVPVIDRAKFEESLRLFMVEIPNHLNECYGCRSGDTMMDRALQAMASSERGALDSAHAAAHQFCPQGIKLVQRFVDLATESLGVTRRELV